MARDECDALREAVRDSRDSCYRLAAHASQRKRHVAGLLIAAHSAPRITIEPDPNPPDRGRG